MTTFLDIGASTVHRDLILTEKSSLFSIRQISCVDVRLMVDFDFDFEHLPTLT